MYRETPDNPHDSGWRFLSGTESQEYMDQSENFAMYDDEAKSETEVKDTPDSAVGGIGC